MAEIKLGGGTANTVGELPAPGDQAPDFHLVKSDLSPVALSDFAGQRLVLNIFPSIDTPTCAASVRRFNAECATLENASVLNVSMDLPFAQGRFCGAEGLDKVVNASDFRDQSFGQAYGVRFADGPLTGLFARAVVVVDENGKVLHSQYVPVLSEEPDYEAALAALGS
jgi:thiol peroxidase